MDSDETLIARAQGGDDAALGVLVERFAPKVLRFGRKLCSDEEDAREVMQETLLAAARGLRGFQGASRFSTWLFSIARSFCIKHRTRGAAALPTRPLEEAGEDELRAVRPTRDRPDERFLGKELAGALDGALRRLSPEQREVIVLRDVEGMTAPEVAEVLSLSVDAVKSRLHRARRALRDELAPFFADERPAVGCPDVLELLSRFQEGDVTHGVCREMEAHVAGCGICAARCDSLRAVLSACRTAPEPEVPEELRARVRTELERALAVAKR